MIRAVGAPSSPRVAAATSAATAARATTSSPTSTGRVPRARVIGLPLTRRSGAAAGVGTRDAPAAPSNGRSELCRVAYTTRPHRFAVERRTARGPARAGPLETCVLGCRLVLQRLRAEHLDLGGAHEPAAGHRGRGRNVGVAVGRGRRIGVLFALVG